MKTTNRKVAVKKEATHSFDSALLRLGNHWLPSVKDSKQTQLS